MCGKEKKRKRNKWERQRELEKGTTHNTQKNEDFLLENDPGGWTKTRIHHFHRGIPTQ